MMAAVTADAVCMEMKENPNEDDIAFVLDSFVDGPEINELIEKVQLIYDDEWAFEGLEERFRFLFDKYQEQPHLLDKSLGKLLADILRVAVANNSPQTLTNKCFKLMYIITKVRNYKNVVGHLPHEVTDMELALSLLLQQNPTDNLTWETRYMLLLWLSIIVMIPFHMKRLDGDASSGDITKKPVMQRIFDIITEYIPIGDKTSDAAAFLAAKFVTRPDTKELYLELFINWSLKTVKESETARTTIGVLTALALVYKHGKRDDLLSYTAKIFSQIQAYNSKYKDSILIRKLSLKLIQRIGLTFLKPRVASWRYQRGKRSIALNLATDNTPEKELLQLETKESDDSDDYDITEELEEVLQLLLDGLRDNETVVRWSAAKGIGRITGRLPKDLADEVVGSVLEMFSLRENDGAWHGGCLALAELGRRGLLLPQRLAEVVPIVLRALVYDEQRGNFSIGSHVRDAACYVCWAFARAYEPSEMQPYVSDIASGLLIVTVFDREVNCRRAASAAFQENVGRQGTFPHGIDILTTADYFSVANRVHSYLRLSVFIAQYPEYTNALINHLVQRKINHWDVTVRELTAKALHNLTPKNPKLMIEEVLPFLLPLTTGLDVNYRHGSILAVAEIVHALALVHSETPIATVLGELHVQNIKEIVGNLNRNGMLQGLGAELTKQAVFCLFEKSSQAKLPFHGDSVLETWQNMFNDSFCFPKVRSQAAAVCAFPAFCLEYYRGVDGLALPGIQTSTVDQYINDIASSTSCNTSMGLAMALGAMPKFMFIGREDLVFKGLLECARITPKTTLWVSARSEAVASLSRICTVVNISDASLVNSVFECLLRNLQDYTCDNRGDSGSVVREAAMTGLQVLVHFITCSDPSLITKELISSVTSGLVQQAVEKIDRTRLLACKVFYSILTSEPEVPNVPQRSRLLSIFPSPMSESKEWDNPAYTFPIFSQLLSFPEYAKSVLLGLVVSVGGLAETQIKHSSPALFTYLKSCNEDVEKLQEFCSNLLEIFRDNVQDDRVTLPLLKTLDQILSSGIVDNILLDSSCSFSVDLIQLIKTETNNSGNHPKLMASIPVLCELLKCHAECRKKVLGQLSIMLCHRYPRVRKETAGLLYEALLANSDIVEGEDTLENIMSILTETNWDDNVNLLRPIRNNLCDLLQIPKPVVKVRVNN